MGLDISLYRIADTAKLKQQRKLEAKYEKESEKLWEEMVGKDVKYEAAPEDKKAEVREASKALAAKMGLDEWGSTPETEDIREAIDEPSEKYPENMNRIGYLRSSYNSGGMNHIFNDILGKDLYDIFQPNDEYEFCPDWENALEVATEMLKDFTASPIVKGNYQVTTIRPNMFAPDRGPTNQSEALKSFLEVKDGHKGGDSDFSWFSNGLGEFFLGKSPTLLAAITGSDNVLGKSNATYLIYQLADDKNGYEYYRESLEIVIENIEYVLAQDNPEQYYLTWSG